MNTISYNPQKPSKNPILNLIRRTWDSPYATVTEGTYLFIKRTVEMLEVDHTDGIGTKGSYHWKARTFKNAVIDALAMNLNDLLLARAVAYKLQNHIVMPNEDMSAITEIMQSLVDECVKRTIIITGGETSFQDNADGMDLSITVTGFVDTIVENKCRVGDVLIGLPSSGLHSNGISKVRHTYGTELRDDFVIPTKIYTEDVFPLFDSYDIHGMMHLTGGAFSKLKDILTDSDIHITNTHPLRPQEVFLDLYGHDISDYDMYTTFNCGVGFVLSVPESQANEIAKKAHGAIIGTVTKGAGTIYLDSMFSDQKIVI